MLRVASAQEDALSVLYDRYSRLVFSLAIRVLGDVALAEEVTQDVFIQLWTKASTYRAEQGKVSTWLGSVARYRAIDILRRQNVRPEGHRVDWAEGVSPDLEDGSHLEESVESDQDRKQVRKAIASLPAEQQAVLALAYFSGMSHQEIATALHEPLGTVKTRLRLGMQKLRNLLEPEPVK